MVLRTPVLHPSPSSLSSGELFWALSWLGSTASGNNFLGMIDITTSSVMSLGIPAQSLNALRVWMALPFTLCLLVLISSDSQVFSSSVVFSGPVVPSSSVVSSGLVVSFGLAVSSSLVVSSGSVVFWSFCRCHIRPCPHPWLPHGELWSRPPPANGEPWSPPWFPNIGPRPRPWLPNGRLWPPLCLPNGG